MLPFTAMTLTRAVKQLETTDLFLVAKDGVNKFIESKFKERFQGFENQYVIIGGTACDLIMENEELPFRATKDVDIVLIVESITAEFGKEYEDIRGNLRAVGFGRNPKGDSSFLYFILLWIY